MCWGLCVGVCCPAKPPHGCGRCMGTRQPAGRRQRQNSGDVGGGVAALPALWRRSSLRGGFALLCAGRWCHVRGRICKRKTERSRALPSLGATHCVCACPTAAKLPSVFCHQKWWYGWKGHEANCLPRHLPRRRRLSPPPVSAAVKSGSPVRAWHIENRITGATKEFWAWERMPSVSLKV